MAADTHSKGVAGSGPKCGLEGQAPSPSAATEDTFRISRLLEPPSLVANVPGRCSGVLLFHRCTTDPEHDAAPGK
jgi:hypothetical protein